jgi:hypothetical protein
MRGFWFLTLISVLGCSRVPSSYTENQKPHHAVNSGIALSTVITSEQDGMPAMRISLKNVATTSISIQTGWFGQVPYPAASFAFRIALRDGRRFELFCDLCGNGGLVPGRPVNYWVELRAGNTWSIDLPLKAFLYVDSGNQCLGNIATRQATIITTIQGVSALSDTDQVNEKVVWAGTVSAETTLPIFSRRVERWLASTTDR